MAYNIDWFIPGRVLFVYLGGVSTVEEAHQSSAEMKRFLDSGKPLVHMIFDDSDLEKVPVSIAEMQKTMQVFKHPSMGWLLAIGDVNAPVRFASFMVTQLFHVRFRRFTSGRELLDFLKDQDQTLDWEAAHYDVLPEKLVGS